jgi:hypothetical protein
MHSEPRPSMEVSALLPFALRPGKVPGTYRAKGWTYHKANVEAVENRNVFVQLNLMPRNVKTSVEQLRA